MPEKKITTTNITEESKILLAKKRSFNISCSVDNKEYLMQYEYSPQDNRLLEKAYDALFEEVFKSDGKGLLL